MIGWLRGDVRHRKPGRLVLDVGGVGYNVAILPREEAYFEPGETVEVWIFSHQREDGIRLYGFSDDAQQQCLQALIAVQGIGAKAALAILQVALPRALGDAIAHDDWQVVARAAGVGTKLAQRVVRELKGKPLFDAYDGTLAVSAGTAQGDAGKAQEAVSALVNLGRNQQDSERVVAAVLRDNPDAGLRDVIREALRAGMRRGIVKEAPAETHTESEEKG